MRECVLAVLVAEGAVVPLVGHSGWHHLLIDKVTMLAAVLQELLIHAIVVVVVAVVAVSLESIFV